MLNLAYRDHSLVPQPLTAGTAVAVEIDLRVIAHVFAPGHCLHLQLLGAAFPILWPLATPFSLTVQEGPTAVLLLPALPHDAELEKGIELAATNPWCHPSDHPTVPASLASLQTSSVSYPSHTGQLNLPDRDIAAWPDAPCAQWDTVHGSDGSVTVRFFDGGRNFGEPETGVTLYCDEGFTFQVNDAAPADTALATTVAYELTESDHVVRAIIDSTIRSDAHYFHFKSKLRVTLDRVSVHEVQLEEAVSRDFR
jgi:hypothetical protein